MKNALSCALLVLSIVSASSSHARQAESSAARKYAEAAMGLMITDLPPRSDVTLQFIDQLVLNAVVASEVPAEKGACFAQTLSKASNRGLLSEGHNAIAWLERLSLHIMQDAVEYLQKKDSSNPKLRAQIVSETLTGGTLTMAAANVAASKAKFDQVIIQMETVLSQACGN